MRPSARIAAIALSLGLAAATSTAQVPPPPPPPPGPDVATRPAGQVAGDPELEPQVTIVRRENETVEEVRIGGELKFVKVTPRHGRPYYLIPEGNGATFIRRNSLDTSLSVPQWVLFSW
jgi:Protein of unknown function (DUF2782)